ncbi:unnamed protein product [Fraxinus pennsylvanica]|uniref:WIYLD domain-containing protein n=1 Tax=Fraxinus pennsylvanica TaxID=56036 RepID=A0AAD2DPI7_9LAMI|nr:unnamed protein product [Fraxinus pennsylvanica]
MRIDAAVDAMISFGFSEEIVRKTVKELLKEYGGDEGWRFIEDNSYIELIEAILRSAEGNNQGKSAQDENHMKDAPAEASCVTTVSLQVTETADNALLDAVGSSSVAQLPFAKEFGDKGNGYGWGSKDIGLDQNSKYKEIDVMGHTTSSSIHCSPPEFPSPPPVTSLPTGRRHLPCFGWLESDEEDDPK